MTAGNIENPAISPTAQPETDAEKAYIRYFADMAAGEYPRAFIVPISPRSSSTILVIVVRQTSAAIIKKNTGKTFAIEATFSMLASNPAGVTMPLRSRTYHLGLPISSSLFWASCILSRASASFSSASSFFSSYSRRPSSSCRWPSSMSAWALAICRSNSRWPSSSSFCQPSSISSRPSSSSFFASLSSLAACSRSSYPL